MLAMTTLLAVVLASESPSLNAMFEPPVVVADYKSMWPRSKSKLLNRMRDDPRVIFYTQRSRPRMFSHYTGQLNHPWVVSEINVPGRALSDGNVEFPWSVTAGMDLPLRNGLPEPMKFIYIPPGGKIRTVIAPRGNYMKFGNASTFADKDGVYRGDQGQQIDFIYPVGTVSGEILVQKVGHEEVVFEVRMRVLQSDGDWNVHVYRPFPNPDVLAERIQELWPDWQQRPDLARLVDHCYNDNAGTVVRLYEVIGHLKYRARQRVIDYNIQFAAEHKEPEPQNALSNSRAQQLFRKYSVVDAIPPIKSEYTKKLLQETDFVECRGEFWRVKTASTDGTPRREIYGYAPTTAANNQIIPREYMGGFIKPNNASCFQCHSTVATPVEEFDYYDVTYGPDGERISNDKDFRNRYWYGSIMGGHAGKTRRSGGGVFSFHPYDPTITTDPKLPYPANATMSPVKYDRRLVAAGLVE